MGEHPNPEARGLVFGVLGVIPFWLVVGVIVLVATHG